MTRTVCAESVWQGESAFATLGEVSIRPDRRIGPEDVRDADILAIRSQTRVDADLLATAACRFVGTATAGYDHFDTELMDSRGIAWAAAPGCNAASVADYITAALLELAVRHGFRLEGRTMGVIGVGQVGSRVAARGAALGMRVLLNDPPLQARTGDKRYLSLEKVLAESDVITMHVPLEKGGRWPTAHMADESFFAAMRPGSIYLNAARGGVTDSRALLAAIDSGVAEHVVLDVWEDEPRVNPELMKRADIATAHIAGHSLDGKLNGTVQIYEQACRCLDREACWNPEPLPPPPVPELTLDGRRNPPEGILLEAVRAVYDIRADDRALRGAIRGKPDDDAAFAALRRNYAPRRELPAVRITLNPPSMEKAETLKLLGFAVNNRRETRP